MTMHECPSCGGKGAMQAFINRGPDIRRHSLETIPCRTCEGQGSISEAQAAAIRHGASLRAERIAKGMTLREAAKEAGMSPSTLSALERGRALIEEASDE